VGWCGLDSSGSGSCEHGNKLSGSIKGGEFFDSLRQSVSQLVTPPSPPWYMASSLVYESMAMCHQDGRSTHAQREGLVT
jgi:hypothetical protein